MFFSAGNPLHKSVCESFQYIRLDILYKHADLQPYFMQTYIPLMYEVH